MADPLYEEYFKRSRARWMAGQTATAAQIRQIYDRAYRDVARDIVRKLPAAPSARHLRQIERALNELRKQVSRDTLDATLWGIRISTEAGTQGAARYMTRLLGNRFEAAGIAALYQAVNEQAVLAFATRTRFDGLRLSDRIWKAGSRWQGYVQRTVESAVARGIPAKDLARSLDQYLKPGTARPSSLAVRRRLGIPKDVSYQSLRVARTEMASAFKEGTVLGHSKSPSYLGVKWEISAGHAFTDECDDLASGGPGNDGIYPAGSEPMQPHPNCMCVLSPMHENLNQFSDRLSRWIDDPSADPRMEAWYEQTARPFFEGRPITRPQGPTKVTVRSGARRAATDLASSTSTISTALANAVSRDTAAGARQAGKAADKKATTAERKAKKRLK